MMKHPNFKAVLAVSALATTLLTGCGGGGSSSPGQPRPAGLTLVVDAAGATLTPATYPDLRLVFDPGTVSGPTALTVQASSPTAQAPQGQGVAPGTTFDIGPVDTALAKPVHVTLTYDPARLTPGTQQDTLQLETLQNGQWTTVGIAASVVSTTTHTVTADISHLGTFGVLGIILNQFAGTYTGTYSGSGPSGTFSGSVDQLVVNPDGTLTASGDGGTFSGTGTVSPTGRASVTTTGSGGAVGGITFTFTGTFQPQNGGAGANGTFTTSANDQGTWAVTHMGSTGGTVGTGGPGPGG